MATAEQIRTWLASPNQKPESNVYRRAWDGKCQALMWQAAYQFGYAPNSYTSARLAMLSSGVLEANSAIAPAGAIHYWDYVTKEGNFGHVALELGGGTVLMASKQVDEFWGNAVGIVNVNVYTQRTGLKYRGWSPRNGRNTIPVEGASVPPAPNPIPAAPEPVQRWLDLPDWWYRYDSAGDALAGRYRKGYGVGKGTYLITQNISNALEIVLPDGSRTWMHPKAMQYVRRSGGEEVPVVQSVILDSWWFSYGTPSAAINGRYVKGHGFGPGSYPVVRIENGAVLVGGTPYGQQWLHPKARAFIR